MLPRNAIIGIIFTVILAIGIGTAAYLSTNRTSLKSKADASDVTITTIETSCQPDGTPQVYLGWNRNIDFPGTPYYSVYRQTYNADGSLSEEQTKRVNLIPAADHFKDSPFVTTSDKTSADGSLTVIGGSTALKSNTRYSYWVWLSNQYQHQSTQADITTPNCPEAQNYQPTKFDVSCNYYPDQGKSIPIVTFIPHSDLIKYKLVFYNASAETERADGLIGSLGAEVNMTTSARQYSYQPNQNYNVTLFNSGSNTPILGKDFTCASPPSPINLTCTVTPNAVASGDSVSWDAKVDIPDPNNTFIFHDTMGKYNSQLTGSANYGYVTAYRNTTTDVAPVTGTWTVTNSSTSSTATCSNSIRLLGSSPPTGGGTGDGGIVGDTGGGIHGPTCTTPPECKTAAGATANGTTCVYPNAADNTACANNTGLCRSGTCAVGACTTSSQCSSGQICNANGLCDAVSCPAQVCKTSSVINQACSYTNAPDSSSCGTNKVCSAGACVDQGTCQITQSACRLQTGYTGTFEDAWGDTNANTRNDKNACLARAQAYSQWCGNGGNVATTATYTKGSDTGTSTFTPTVATYRISESPDELKRCQNQPQDTQITADSTVAGTGQTFICHQYSYTDTPVTKTSYEFRNKTLGAHVLFVDFIQNNLSPTGKEILQSVTQTVNLAGPTIQVAGLNCTTDISTGKGLSIDLRGRNFNSKTSASAVKANGAAARLTSWSDSAVSAVVDNPGTLPQTGQDFQIEVTRDDGQKYQSTCKVGVSTLSVGASAICHAPSQVAQSNVEMTLTDAVVGGKTITKTTSIDKDGHVVGIDNLLKTGACYKLSLKTAKSVRKTVEFQAQLGTTIIPNFTLPIGDIAPVGGDGRINTADRSELIHEWGLTTANPASRGAATAKVGDFNNDGVINSYDFSCIVHDYNASDDPIPAPGPVSGKDKDLVAACAQAAATTGVQTTVNDANFCQSQSSGTDCTATGKPKSVCALNQTCQPVVCDNDSACGSGYSCDVTAKQCLPASQ